EPRTGGDLSRTSSEVECELRSNQARDKGCPGTRKRPAAEGSGRRELLRTQARQRRGLHLPPLRSGRVRGRLPPGRAEGDDVLRAVGKRGGDGGLDGRDCRTARAAGSAGP